MARDPGLVAFDRCTSDMEAGLNPPDITGRLFAEGIITPAEKEDIVSMSSRFRAASTLVHAVSRHLQNKPSNFFVFVKILEWEPAFDGVTRRLKEEYDKALKEGQVKRKRKHIADPVPFHEEPYPPQVKSQRRSVESDNPLEGTQEALKTPTLQKRGYIVSTRESHALAVIFNNKEFPSVEGLCDFPGSERDVDRLERVLRDLLGFEVVKYENKTSKQMKQLFRSKFGGKIRQDHDSIFCCIMSHGGKDRIYGIDGLTVTPGELITCLDGSKCSELLGKPKIMIIDCCRGSDIPQPEIYKAKGGPSKQVAISPHADFICAYSTTIGTIAIIGKCGSPYVQSLCDVLETNVNDDMGWSLNYMLCLVNRRLSEKGIWNVEDGIETHEFVQTGQVEHTLRDFVFFHTE